MKGFTLIEVIITMAIIAILAGISMPVYKILQQKNNLETAEFAVVGAMRRAQVLAQAAKDDSNWGVHIENSQVSVFKGLDYAGRDASSDEDFSFSPRINHSGLTDIIFNKLSGWPQATGLIILSIPDDSKTIAINQKGTIDY